MAKKTAKKSAPYRKTTKGEGALVSMANNLKKGMKVKGTITGKVTSSKPNSEEVKKPKLPSKSKAKTVKVRVGKAAHGIVIARAGCGKTFSMVMGIVHMFKMVQVGAKTLWLRAEDFLSLRKGKPVKVKPSDQQAAIWEYMAWEKPRTIRYMAFNNSVVDEFSAEWGWLITDLKNHAAVDLSFSTIHSLGYEAIQNKYGSRIRRAKFKTTDLLAMHWNKDLNEVWKEKGAVIEAVRELVRLCKIKLVGCMVQAKATKAMRWQVDMEQLVEVANDHGVDMEGNDEEICDLVNVLINKGMEHDIIETMGVDFDDMLFLPVVLDLPIQQFDLLIVDEGQDMSAARHQIALKAGRRIIVVGDNRQAIYGFAGAETNSLGQMQDYLNHDKERKLEVYTLTKTFRCGKAIVSHVNRLVDDIEAMDGNPEGRIERIGWETAEGFIGVQAGPGFDSLGEDNDAPEVPPQHDMVISRVNAPIVRLAFSLLREGKRFEYRGSDMKNGLKWFIRKSGIKADVGQFVTWLDGYVKMRIEKMQKRIPPNADQIALLQDKAECLTTLAQGSLTIRDLNKSIDQIFCAMKCPKCGKLYEDGTEYCWDKTCKAAHGSMNRHRGWNQQEGVKLERIGGPILSSVHRAKGLEAKRVFILRPDLMPHPLAKQQWEKEQEVNLQYVAETRAIETLVYVDGKPGKQEE